MKKLQLIGSVIGLAVCAGCETETPYFDAHLGTASAHMVQAQTLDPAVAGNPAVLAPAGADGQRIKTAVDNYHHEVNRPETVARPMVFDTGQQQ